MTGNQKDEEFHEESQLICRDENLPSCNPDKIRFVGMIASARPIFSPKSVRHKSKWLLESETWPKPMSTKSVSWKQLTSAQEQNSKLVFNNQIYKSSRNSDRQTQVFQPTFKYGYIVSKNGSICKFERLPPQRTMTVTIQPTGSPRVRTKNISLAKLRKPRQMPIHVSELEEENCELEPDRLLKDHLDYVDGLEPCPCYAKCCLDSLITIFCVTLFN